MSIFIGRRAAAAVVLSCVAYPDGSTKSVESLMINMKKKMDKKRCGGDISRVTLDEEVYGAWRRGLNERQTVVDDIPFVHTGESKRQKIGHDSQRFIRREAPFYHGTSLTSALSILDAFNRAKVGSDFVSLSSIFQPTQPLELDGISTWEEYSRKIHNLGESNPEWISDPDTAMRALKQFEFWAAGRSFFHTLGFGAITYVAEDPNKAAYFASPEYIQTLQEERTYILPREQTPSSFGLPLESLVPEGIVLELNGMFYPAKMNFHEIREEDIYMWYGFDGSSDFQVVSKDWPRNPEMSEYAAVIKPEGLIWGTEPERMKEMRAKSEWALRHSAWWVENIRAFDLQGNNVTDRLLREVEISSSMTH